MSVEQVKVEVGQVWADNDKRSRGRTLRVERIDQDVAVCRILTNDERTQDLLTRPRDWYQAKDRRGSITRIALRRMRPTSTGYRLVEPAPARQP